MTVAVQPGTRAAALYPAPTATDRSYRNFGVNPDHVDELVAAGVVVSGTDQDGEPRIVELPDQRFYLGTLFVPQTSSTPASPHPIVRGFVAAVHAQAAVAHPRVGGTSNPV
jgi:CTP synthase (UTP-ammonia lyase)